VLGHIINILSDSLDQAVQENIPFSASVLAPYGRVNTASLEPNILVYCPPTRAIIYM